MGVQKLTTFAKQQPQIYNRIDILDEIRRWKEQNHQQNPTIIFDVMGFVHVLGQNKVELDLGGRQHQYLRTFERFLRKLIDAGALLAFFCDGQLQADKNDEWCERRDSEYQDTVKAMTNITLSKRRFGCKTIVKSLLKLIEDKGYGKVIISTQIDCDLAIANYAAECSALAVIASDSDFLIFDGDFQWWHTDQIDMNRMLVDRFECNKFMESLNLTREQMKYLATIAGNDYTKRSVHKSPNFNKIVPFCRTLSEPRGKNLKLIVEFMQIDRRMAMKEAFDCVTKSIKSYDIDAVDKETERMDKMDEYCSTNVLMYAFRNQQVFQYEMNFVDFNVRNQLKQNNNNNNVYSFVDILVEVFRKLAGIMLKNTDHRNATLKIVTKYSKNDNYALKLHTPIYPRGFIDYDAILFGKANELDDTKWELLLWSIGLDPKLRIDLRKIPRNYVPTILALMFLLQNGEISLLVADTVLVAQYHLQELKLNVNVYTQIANIHTESVRIGHLFNRTNTLIWDCLMVCGLKSFIQLDWYDGPYFNHLMQKSEDLYKKNIQPIDNYRIYTKVMLDNGIDR